MVSGTVVSLPDEAATLRLGADLALALRPGDMLLLKGDLGAGKTTLARALIRAVAGNPSLEVPSPTFTLVQAYETQPPIQHFDLYRLSSPDELDELGLEEAAAESITLVEWPERASGRFAASAVTLELSSEGEGRVATLSGAGPAFDRLARSLGIRAFLGAAGWGAARRQRLTGDASARAYEVVSLPEESPRLLMDSPPIVLGPAVRDGKPYALIAHSALSVHAFVAIDTLLLDAGFAAPRIHARDLDRGLLLVEDLGSETLADAEGQPISERYVAAAELLADMHARSWPVGVDIERGVTYTIPAFDREAMLIEAELAMDWYAPAYLGAETADRYRQAFRDAWNAVLDRLSDTETTLMLRDVQSPNFLWRGERSGNDRLGLIDFQDALIGPSAYDVASLALDPRVTVPPAMRNQVVNAYAARRHENGLFDASDFARAFAIMGAQRHTKILGIFVRLHRRDGKPYYLPHLPRIRAYVAELLVHPALAEVRQVYDAMGLLAGEPG